MAANKRGGTLSHILTCTVLLLVSLNTFAQRDSVHTKRLRVVIVTTAVAVPATYAGLYQLWYKNSARQSFRFFNDNAEWKQLDKAGHFISTFYFSYGSSQVLRWADVSPKRADLVGAMAGFLITAPIELFDGFSADYGASAGDLIADAAGPLFFLGQKKIWNEIRLIPKISFHRTDFAPLRPRLLGETLVSEIVKDYNGQTYWLCADMDKFIKFPKWLNLAAGYGGEGMVFARDAENHLNGYDAYRQFYLSLDLDLTAIRTRSKVVKTLLFLGSIVKFPAPTLEFSKKGAQFRAFYF
jgi:uncharacterized protein YfiM (DUF2279 family)